MRYMRRTAGYTWTDYKTNAQITKELKTTPILDKFLEYKRNWIQHVNRMPRIRLPRVMKYYSPTGRRNHGRTSKRLLGTWDWNGSTSGPTPWKIDDDVIDDDYDDDLLHWPCAGCSAGTHSFVITRINPNTNNPQPLVPWGTCFSLLLPRVLLSSVVSKCHKFQDIHICIDVTLEFRYWLNDTAAQSSA